MKMQKILRRALVFMLVFGINTIAESGDQVPAALLLARKIFGSHGTHNNPEALKKLEENLTVIMKASPSQHHQAAFCAIGFLKAQQQQLEQKIIVAQAGLNQENIEQLHFSLYLINHYIDSLASCAKEIIARVSGMERMQIEFTKAVEQVRSLFDERNLIKKCAVDPVAQAVLEFISFERQEIFVSYQQTVAYFAVLRKQKIPSVINFWNDGSARYKVAQRVKRLEGSLARVQFLESLLEIAGSQMASIAETTGPLALQAAIMGGGSMFNQWLSQEAAQEFIRLSNEQKKISDDFSEFVQKLQNKRTKQVQEIVHQFVEAQKSINQKYQDLINRAQQEYIYLLQSISLSVPLVHYLVAPISYDQLQQASIMTTPDGANRPWFNVFKDVGGDWEFDAKTQRFWQRSQVAFGTPYWSPFNGNDNPNLVTIFTEYIASAPTWNLSVECDLVAAAYPFFAGIMFNRGRWISGDPERINQYRLLGFYGTQADPKNDSSRKVSCCFAQQIIKETASAQGKTEEKIISALEQCTSNPSTKLFDLATTDVQSLEKNPHTYRFDILIESARVSYTVFKKSADGSYAQLNQGVIDRLDPYISVFSGVGFMAAGCQASFKIIVPKELAYSPDQISKFSAARTSQKGRKK